MRFFYPGGGRGGYVTQRVASVGGGGGGGRGDVFFFAFPEQKKRILILFNSCTTVAASASAVTLILSPDFYDIRIQPTVPSSSPFATAAYSSSSFALAATFTRRSSSRFYPSVKRWDSTDYSLTYFCKKGSSLSPARNVLYSKHEHVQS